jgi:hypothetical protein
VSATHKSSSSRTCHQSDTPPGVSAATLLAGTKKVQQVLAAPGVLERFVASPEVGGLYKLLIQFTHSF